MAAPVTYAAWTTLLDQFGEGDDAALEALSNCSFIVDAGTAARFYQRVEQVYKKRKQHWLDKFQRSFQLQNFKTEDDFAIALRNGKQNLSPLSRFVALNGLPNDLRDTLQKDLDIFVAEIKKSLRENVSKVSGRREQMLILLNSFGLNALPAEIDMDTKNNKQNSSNSIPATGRKIIFNNGK